MKKRRCGKQSVYDRHHLIPTSRGGTNHNDNQVRVKAAKHRAYHVLFGNSLPHEAIQILIEQWFYKDKGLKVSGTRVLIGWLEKRIMDELKGS